MRLFIVFLGNNISSSEFKTKTKSNNVTCCTVECKFFCKYVINDVCNIIYVNGKINQESFAKKNNAKMPVKQLSNTFNANKRHASFAMPLQDIFVVAYKNKRYGNRNIR